MQRGQVNCSCGGASKLTQHGSHVHKAPALVSHRQAGFCMYSDSSWQNLPWIPPTLHQTSMITSTSVMRHFQGILWWQKFARSWNGIAFFLDPTWTPASELQLFTDASSTLGLGGYWNVALFQSGLASRPLHQTNRVERALCHCYCVRDMG